MKNFVCDRIPALFENLLGCANVSNLNLNCYCKQDIKITQTLCQYIIDIFNLTIQKENQYDVDVLAIAYKAINKQCACIEGFCDCSLYQCIEKYFYYLESEIYNDVYKSEAERAVLSKINLIKEFIKVGV